MAFDIASVLKTVSDSGTTETAEKIEYIDAGKISADENNFYSLSNLDELAASIELMGIQQPLRVRPSGTGYIIVSGHRRFAASQLAGIGKIPCIVERQSYSPAMQELRLIYANKDTRILTAAEIGRQAERVKALLYQLKEEGVEFPGRMRDYVAEACNVSKSKLARLDVIRKNLIEEFRNAWERNDLSESAAYYIAQQEPDMQKNLYFAADDAAPEWTYKNVVAILDRAKKWKCQGSCTGCMHAIKIAKHYVDEKPWCCGNQCCGSCDKLTSCGSSCPQVAAIKQGMKKEAKERKYADKLVYEARLLREKAEREECESLSKDIWRKTKTVREASGIPGEDLYENFVRWESYENGDETSTYYTPFGRTSIYDVISIKRFAEKTGASIDEILGIQKPEPETVPESDTGWNTGMPEKDGLYYAVFDCDGTKIKNVCKIDNGTAYFPNGWNRIEATIEKWHKLPED